MFLYEVLPNESLEEIADRFATTPGAILEANNITNASLIQPGIVMCVPAPPRWPYFPWPVDLSPAALRIVDGLLYVLYTDRTFYTPGQAIHIMFVKTNISPRPIRLTYPTSQRFDLVAVQNNREIWRWFRDRVFLPSVAVVELYPGQSLMYSTVWDQTPNNPLGIELGPGLFTLSALNTAAELDDERIEQRIRIQLPEAPPTPGPGIPRNFIRDPGLEQWIDPTHLVEWTGVNIFRSSQARTGNFAVELGSVPNQQANFTQEVPNLTTGSRYQLCFHARENVREGNRPGYTLTAQIIFLDTQGRELDRNSRRLIAADIPTGRYQQFCLTSLAAPAELRTTMVNFIFEPASTNTNTVKIDDVRLELA